VADLRAPTPTAAAELAAEPRANWLAALDLLQDRLRGALLRQMDRQSQRLDLAAGRLGRPSGLVARQRLALSILAQRLRHGASHALVQRRRDVQQLAQAWPRAVHSGLQAQQRRLDRAGLRLQLLDPALVLQRGYAWLSDGQGRTISRVGQTHAGQALQATLADGKVDLTVTPRPRD
jgi:exodeoxyribonuclease VII large subunit